MSIAAVNDVSPIQWGDGNPKTRGPIIARSRSGWPRNVIGAYGADSALWVSLANAVGKRDPDHRPDFSHALPEEPIIKPNSHWSDPSKIVTFDPFGHVAPQIFQEEVCAGADIRPTIAITTAKLTIPEIFAELVKDKVFPIGSLMGSLKRSLYSTETPSHWLLRGIKNPGKAIIAALEKNGRLFADGVVLNSSGEIRITKIAIHPVWYLPGVADRLGIAEDKMRAAMVEGTNGMYEELTRRPELKVFLPPIKGSTVYIFGNPEKLGDPSTFIASRTHDECNSSDVFGSDICTCRPYLMHGVNVSIKAAQKGGVGVIVYNHKEARNLGEVVKYWVYNARGRHPGGDTPAMYFAHTHAIAGVEDARFQNLMPDVYGWLGLNRIDELVSMSHEKHEAITGAGIEVVRRVSILDCLVPAHAKRVELAAKIGRGYHNGD